MHLQMKPCATVIIIHQNVSMGAQWKNGLDLQSHSGIVFTAALIIVNITFNWFSYFNLNFTDCYKLCEKVTILYSLKTKNMYKHSYHE